MANPLIPMEQAAKMLGLSDDKLTEMRSNNEIFGYRDGSSWKFKMSELQRVAGELDIKLGVPGISVGDSDVDVAGDALDLSGSGLGESDINLGDDLTGSGLGSSDILLDEPVAGGDEELILADDDLIMEDSSSSEYVEEESSVEILSKPISAVNKALNLDDDVEELKLEESGELIFDTGEETPVEAESVDILDDEEEALSFGSSSLSLAPSSKKLDANDTGDLLDDVEGGGGSPSDTGKMLADEDDMLLSEENLFGDDLSLADSGSLDDSAELSSDFEDSDLIMDDSDSSTELVFDSQDGINLSANESGISLEEEPIEMSGSDIGSLELPDDDMIVLDDPADPAAATMMADDDFNLTPVEDSMDDDTSGSQIIALEDSEIYADESSATVLGDSDMMQQPGMLVDDASGFAQDPQYPDAGMGMGLAPAGMAGAPAVPVVPEAPFSIFQVLSLGLIAVLLSVGGMIAYDICRNLWTPADSIVSSGVLQIFLDLFGIKG